MFSGETDSEAIYFLDDFENTNPFKLCVLTDSKGESSLELTARGEPLEFTLLKDYYA